MTSGGILDLLNLLYFISRSFVILVATSFLCDSIYILCLTWLLKDIAFIYY